MSEIYFEYGFLKNSTPGTLEERRDYMLANSPEQALERVVSKYQPTEAIILKHGEFVQRYNGASCSDGSTAPPDPEGYPIII